MSGELLFYCRISLPLEKHVELENFKPEWAFELSILYSHITSDF